MQEAQREAAPGVTERRGCVCAVWMRCWKKGQSGQGIGWHHMGKHVRSWLFIKHTATCLCLHIKWKRLHYNYFQRIYTLCVCIYICKPFSSAPLSQISVKAHVFDLNQLMGVNTNQSLEAETESSGLLCSFACVFSPSLYTYKYAHLGFVWLIAFWGTEIWSSVSLWFPIHYSHWMNQSCRLSVFRGRVPVGGSLNPTSCAGWCPVSYLN